MITTRILLTTRYYLNGQTTHVFTLCSELLRQGHEILLVITHLDPFQYAPFLRQAKIPFTTNTDPERLLNLLKNWQPELIHNHSAHTLTLTLELGHQLQIPTLSTIHYLDFQPLELLEKQDAVIFISEEMKELFSNLTIPGYVIENGVPLPQGKVQNKPWEKNALFLAQVSTEKEKNFRAMAESLLAWGWNVTSAGNWRFPGVNYLGWVNNAELLLEQNNLLIGTGRAIREGMASACTCWILGEYSDGLLTPERIERLQKTNFSGRQTKSQFSPYDAAPFLQHPSPSVFQTLGDFGRSYARQHFSIKAMVEKLSLLYQTLYETHRKRNKTGKSSSMSNII